MSTSAAHHTNTSPSESGVKPFYQPGLSLRTKLIVAFLLIAVMPLIGYTLLTDWVARQSLTAQSEAELLAAAKATAANLDVFIDDTVSEVQALAQVPSIGTYLGLEPSQRRPSLNAQHVNALLQSMRRSDEKHIVSYALIDRKGQNILDTVASNIGQDEADRSYVQAILQGARPSFVSPVELDIDNGTSLLHFSVPVRDALGETVGVLRVRYSADVLQDVMLRSNGLAGEQSFGILLDEYHIRLAHGDAPNLILTSVAALDVAKVAELQAARRLPDRPIEELSTNLGDLEAGLQQSATNPIVSASLITQGGKPGTGAVAPLTSQPWVVAFFQPREVFLAPVTAQSRTAFTLTLISVALVSVSAYVLGRRVANPLTQLTTLTSRFMTGDLTVRAPVSGRDEIGTLAQTFNTMAQQVGELVSGYQERTRELEASQRVTFAASEHKNPSDLLKMVVNLIRDQFDLYHVQVYMLDDTAQTAVLRESTGYAGYQLLQRHHQIPLTQTSLVTQTIQQGEPVLVDDVTQDPNFLPNPLLPETRAELVVPLRNGERIIGALDAQSREPHRFTPSTVALFQTMTEQITFLFENSELLEHISQQADTLTRFASQLRTAAEMAERLNSILDPEVLIHQSVALIQERFDLYHVHIYLLDESKQQLVVRGGSGEVGQLLYERGHTIPMSREQSLVAQAARSQRVVLVNDTDSAPNFMANPLLPRTKAEVAIPLMARGVLLGVLDVQDNRPHRFADTDLDTLNTLAGQVATALQNGYLFVEQKRIEAAALAAEAKFHSLVDQSLVGIYTIQDGKFTYVNPKFAEIFGYSVDEIKLIEGKKIIDLVAPESHEIVAENVRRREQTPELGMHYTFRGLRRDGSLVDVEVHGTSIELDGRPCLIGGLIDITERRRTEEILRASEERLHAILDNSPAVVYVKDLEGRYQLINRQYEKLFGVTREQVKGQTDFDIFPEEIATAFTANDRHVLQEAIPLELEEVAPQADGEHTFLSVKFPLLGADGVPYALCGISTDITERIQTEAERARFTAQLRTAAEVAQQVNTILDPEPLLQEVVSLLQSRFALYHVHLYTLDEATHDLVIQAGSGEVGKQLRAAGHRIPMDRARSLVARAARTQDVVMASDVSQDPNFMPNPLLPDTRSEIAVPLVAHGRLVGVLDLQDNAPNRFTQTDVDILNTLAGHIATTLINAQLYIESQEVVDRLREVDRLKSEFLASMSHELRTPLNSIIGYAEVMLMGLDGELDSESREDIQAIYDSGQHLLRLINDVLDLAKIEAGRMTLEIEDVSVPVLLEGIQTATTGLFKNKPLNLIVEVKERLPLIKADPLRLDQILINLISNAVKFTAEGNVYLRAFRHDDWVTIEVEDTGVGMSEQEVEVIFEAFRQTDSARKRRASGTGLGLAITRHLVNMHGGTIDVHSAVGQGTTFAVNLPLRHDPVIAETNPLALTRGGLSTR